MRTASWVLVTAMCTAVAAGCGGQFQTEPGRFVNLSAGAGYDRGLVVCLSGVGGAVGEVGRIHEGLVEGGVQCAIEEFRWATGNMLVDQMDLTSNKAKAWVLARRIERYRAEHPGCPVHLIGVSAGTGLVIWAVEDLGPEHQVDNAVLIASSLSSRYNLGAAMRKISGCLVVHHSAVDTVLGLIVPATGTVDRSGGEAGGLHGFQAPAGADELTQTLYRDRLLQIEWSAADMACGHLGDHLGGTQPAYVREHVASLVWARQPETGTEATGLAAASEARPNSGVASAATSASAPAR